MYKTFMDWKRLDPRNQYTFPAENELVVLRLKDKRYPTMSVQYEVGHYEVPKGRRKLYWCKGSFPRDPLEMDQRYEISWCPLPPFTADGKY